MTFLAVVSLPTTPIFPRRLSSVLSKFSRKKINFIQVPPLDGVTRGSLNHTINNPSPPRTPLNFGQFWISFQRQTSSNVIGC